MELTEKQRIWDMCMLQGWHRFQNTTVVIAIYMSLVYPFKEEDHPKIEVKDELATLKRVPRYLRQGMRSAIAEDMAWLSRQLWAETKSDDELVSMMTEAGYDLEKVSRQSHPSRKQSNDHLKKAGMSKEAYSKGRRSNQWGTTKGVRSK